MSDVAQAKLPHNMVIDAFHAQAKPLAELEKEDANVKKGQH